MLTLYHMAGAICAQKVRLCLAEKGVSWDSKVTQGPMLRSPEYLKLNPGGYVPTLVHDDRIITESRIICEYINDAFDGPSLMPEDAYDRAKVGLWTKQIDDTLHLNVFTLTCAASLRHAYARMTPEQLEIMLPLDITKRERTRDIIAKAEQSHYVPVAIRRFVKLTDDMERALQQSEWLACDRYSLADVDYTPYLQRLLDMGLAPLVADKPALQDWWARVQARPSFSAVQKDWFSPEETERARTVSGQAAEAFAPYLAAA